MENKEITVPVKIYEYHELPQAYASLVEAARRMTYRSYAPYSRFSVGAAVLLSDSTVVTGCNQENAAYPSGLCAERTAAFYANSEHPGIPFAAIAIAARATDGEFTASPVAPCGACRQSLLEYEKLAGQPVPVLLAGRERVYMLDSVASLLPICFDSFE